MTNRKIFWCLIKKMLLTYLFFIFFQNQIWLEMTSLQQALKYFESQNSYIKKLFLIFTIKHLITRAESFNVLNNWTPNIIMKCIIKGCDRWKWMVGYTPLYISPSHGHTTCSCRTTTCTVVRKQGRRKAELCKTWLKILYCDDFNRL